jgi:predicted DNA-binding protein
MDTDRWKSILVPREVYEEIKVMSKTEGRTISGQLRVVFEEYKTQKYAITP